MDFNSFHYRLKRVFRVLGSVEQKVNTHLKKFRAFPNRIQVTRSSPGQPIGNGFGTGSNPGGELVSSEAPLPDELLQCLVKFHKTPTNASSEHHVKSKNTFRLTSNLSDYSVSFTDFPVCWARNASIFFSGASFIRRKTLL